MSKIGLIGDFDAEVVAHMAIPQVIQLASHDLGCQMEIEWIPASSLEKDYEQKLATFQALWTVPASPYKSMQGGSKVADIYGEHEIVEQYGICNYGLNPEFAPLLEKAGMRIAGVDLDGEVRIMELMDYPFFVGTLFQPERSALKNIVHPLIRAFLQKAIQ